MIAYLKGTIESCGENWIILDVYGVGYLTYCSSRTLTRLPDLGKTATLYVEMHVRAEAITLYGFLDHIEQSWFRLLTTVQGVGAKVALHLLSAMSPNQLAHALATQDKASLTCVVGIGPRLASRILTELKDKNAKSIAMLNVSGIKDEGESKQERGTVFQTTTDAISVLINLGYARAEAFAMIVRAEAVLATDVVPDIETLVRAALQEDPRGSGETNK